MVIDNVATRRYNYFMKISHPLLATCVYLGIGFLLAHFGIRDGSLLLLDAIGGIVFYKLIVSAR